MSSSTLHTDIVSEPALVAIDAAARPERWDDLCDLIACRLGAPAFMVFPYDTARPQAPLFYGSEATRTPASRSLLAELRAGSDAEDHPIYSAMASAEPFTAFQEGELLGLSRGATLPTNLWRERVLSTTHGRARSIMKFNNHGPYVDVAVAHEGAAFDSGPPAMANLTPFLGSLLARTMESTRVVEALASSHARLMSLFDSLDFGAAFCTNEGRVLAANATFRSMTADRDGLSEVSGALHGRTRDATAAIRARLAAAAQPDSPPDSLTLTLPRRSSQLPLVLRAAPIFERELSSAIAVLLVAIDPADERRLSTRGLAAFDLLTPAELDVCDHLIRGQTTKAIAERRGTSSETTRDQIKSATAKLSCRNRLDLLRLALASNPPVREGNSP